MFSTLRPILLCFLAAGLFGCGSPGSEASQAEPVRPSFKLKEMPGFDPAAIPAYAGDHAQVYSHIDQHLDEHLAQLQRWLRQPSISAQDDGVLEMAELLRQDLEDMGFAEAELVPTDGHPGVWGYYDAGAEKTLMLYMMYDVQPVNPDDWQVPPFEGALVDHELGSVLMARGATNQKGPERALLNALQSIIDVHGTLPVNIMLAAEGEEELGSPHYPQIIDKYEERLKQADGVLFPFNSQDRDGGMTMSLGVKGIIYFELEARGDENGGPMKNEIHGSYKAMVDAPAWRLTQALASLTTADGNTIRVPGYYDGIRQPNDEEYSLINGMLGSWDEAQIKQQLGVERWVDGKTGADALMEYLYMPTLNIDGMWSGYTGEGVKTILPHVATAKVDSRLPPGIDPEQALASIRSYLDAQGFADIVMRKKSAYPAAQTSIEAPLVRAAIGVFNRHQATVRVQPRLAGSAPFYQFTERLKLPLVFTGLGLGTGAHGPNEFMLIKPAEGVKAAGLAEIEKGYVDLVYALSR
ncbi:MAG: M20/M25/M40 family metallo-hydrolase [Gammaproteobacteria bacterium]|nr:M20/M25/M40 family metallo-hydrolase [Gammaproteobacteria bacterium]